MSIWTDIFGDSLPNIEPMTDREMLGLFTREVYQDCGYSGPGEFRRSEACRRKRENRENAERLSVYERRQRTKLVTNENLCADDLVRSERFVDIITGPEIIIPSKKRK